MQIVFYSNFLNLHQLPLCIEFSKHSEIQFTFVACEKIPQERLDMQYQDLDSQYPFVLKAYSSKTNYEYALKLAETADVVIHGAAPNIYLENRLKKNKITFKFCERSLKKGTWRRFIPITYKKIYDGYIRYRKKSFWVLCASAYASNDLRLCGFPVDKCFKWGYFPELEQLDPEEIWKHKKPNSILWVGRNIPCKHLELAIQLAKNLKKQNYHFELNIIGSGQSEELKSELTKQKLDKNVHLLGSMEQEYVRKYMKSSEIFLFTSDFYEGWGAVVNEAMNSACALVISHACGSAKYLINRNNGSIFSFPDQQDLFDKVTNYLNNKDLAKTHGLEAYYSLANTWSVSNAVNNFLEIVKNLPELDCYNILEGPGSRAEPVKNNWIKYDRKSE